MPIARFEVRNEYGLGQPELYRNVDREDPKGVLDGIAVAGLVGILRQLGDLAEFAAEIFHGIQEEVMATASRSNKLKIRLQHIEATVPSLQKSMLSQTCHLHFAYTAGRVWHPRIPNEQNHFICYNLPRFIMDSYEECWGPPRLHLLDKFDIDGPGSCLKRYSDPSYLVRTSGKSIEANSDFQKDNKNRNVKKKKSMQRKRDISRLASVGKQSYRKQCISISFSGQTSSSASTNDTELKSDLQDHSHSVSSRSGLGYIVHTETSSVKTEENPLGPLSSSSLTPGALTITSVISESHSEDADNHFLYSPYQEQASHASSCPEVMETSFAVDAPGEKTTRGGKTGGADFRCNNIEGAESVSSVKQYAEIEAEQVIKVGHEIEKELDSDQETESEGDTFVDALNTIESESDNDFGFHMSGEVQKNPDDTANESLEALAHECDLVQPCPSDQDREQSLDNVEEGRLVDGLKDHSLENDRTSCAVSDLQANMRISSGPETLSSANAYGKPISQDSDSVTVLENQSPHSDLSAGRDGHDDSKGQYDFKSPSVSAPSDSLSGSSNSSNSKKSEEASHNVQPTTIWTNGGLLGLKPSNPVFAVPKTEDAEKGKSNTVAGNAPQFQMVPSYTSEKYSQPFADPYDSDEPKQTHSDGSADYSGYQCENHETLSGALGLSHRLLMNGVRRKDYFARDRKIVPATIPENDEGTETSGFSGRDTDELTFEEPFRDETPFDWLTSSPPLEHMKISFNPAESLHISKLKLKFPDGGQRHECNKFTFSSFQLVPESATSVPDFDSDDDTFCRSSPYMSDRDYPSDNDSVSSSKQWEESSTNSERKDRELYDSLHRSTNAKHEAEPYSLSVPLHNAPSFETLKPSLQVEATKSSVPGSLVEPLPPPLPPVQWRVSKPFTESFEDKQWSLQDELKNAFDEKCYQSIDSQQSCADPVNKEQPSVVFAVPKPDNNVHQKNNGREDKQNGNVKETEAGDFLHQIRTKQFNLRRIGTTRPSTAARTGPVPNTSISAILEKASSIRQAVASNDGDESDTWSDM